MHGMRGSRQGRVRGRTADQDIAALTRENTDPREYKFRHHPHPHFVHSPPRAPQPTSWPPSSILYAIHLN